jgi:hypothetical protein
MADPPSDKEIARWIARLGDDADFLSEWEAEFLREVTEQWARRRTLSAVQVELLERIVRGRLE